MTTEDRHKISDNSTGKTEEEKKDEETEIEEFLWYPEFGLIDNPFRFSDYRIEREYEEYGYEYPYISTEATENVLSIAKGKTSAFIVGDRGCGKSVALAEAYKQMKHSLIFEALSPNHMVEIYNSLCLIIYLKFDMARENLQNPNLKRKLSKTEVQEYNELLELLLYNIEPYIKWESTDRCAYHSCRHKPRCRFVVDRARARTDPYQALMVIGNIVQVRENCGLKREFVHHFVHVTSRDWIFLLDAPNDLVETGAGYFRNLLEHLLLSGTVIIMATREQYESCSHQDVLARLSCYEFPILKVETLKKIYEARLELAQKEHTTSPFSEEVVCYLANESRGNPRKFIQACNSILVEMQRKGLKEQASVDFIEKCRLPLQVRVTVAEAYRELVASYVQNKRVWVLVSEIQKDLKERYNLEISAKSVGRELQRLMKKGLVLDYRRAPYSAYKFT